MSNIYKLPIEEILTRLGYIESSNLFKQNDFSNAPISSHTLKVLLEVNPYAAYILDGKPFVVFFDKSFDNISFKQVNKLVWNAQIPIVFFCDERSVKIYNGTSMDMESHLLNSVKNLTIQECTMHSEFSYWEISNPMFWSKYSSIYTSIKLNEYLLSNIKFMTETLKNKYHIKFATKLVLRIIFIRYLIDRGVDLAYSNFSNNIEHSKNEFLNTLQEKETLYKLFEYLKNKFNGNLFDLDDEIDSPELTADVFRLLREFISGEISLSDGQLSLFSMYDFNIIPVELISNIYEILLGNETRQKDNAFYTPNYLVEYILDKTTLAFLQKNKEYKILDPACGSGIFLVDSYRRIVEQTLGDKLYCEDDSVLKTLLSKNIYGIDINDEAIDVTIFSLYLTILDYKDPKTLQEFNLPNVKGTNLFVSDFFNEEKLYELTQIEFDFIIGNPPWGNVKSGLHMTYCKNRGYIDKQQNNEISRSFVFRTKDFSSPNTVCCFILHSKLLYNQKKPAKNFRKFILEETEIQNIVEMSSVRKLVFKNADAPAVIMMYKYSDKNNLDNKIIYTSLKPNLFFKLFDIIVVEKNDIKHVVQRLLFSNDWAWKTIVYGFSVDFEVIQKLKKDFVTLNEAIENQIPKLVMGAGVEYQDGDELDAKHLLGRPLLDSKNGVKHFYVNSNKTTIFTKPKIHRPREKELFEPPYVLIAKGVDCDNYKMKAAYSEESFISKTTMYLIKGTKEQKSFLINMVGLLNSSLYAYLNVMLGSSIGIEREQRFMLEVLSFPYKYSNSNVEKTENIQNKLKENSLFELSDNQCEISDLDDNILELFDLNNNKFIDYAINVQIPELTNSNDFDMYRKVDVDNLIKYSECFKNQFSLIYSRSGKHILMNIYPDILNRFCAFELSVCNDKPKSELNIITVNDENKELLSKLCVYKHNDVFFQLRDVIHFSDNSFFIIKPNHYKYWHPAIAELDLADVTEQIMSDAGGEQ